MLGNMWIYKSKQLNNSKFGKSKKVHTIHIINKQWVKTKRILKATKLTLHIKEILNKIMSEFFSLNQEIYAKRQWNDLLKVLITKYLPTENTVSGKVPFRSKVKIKTFSNKQK